MENFLNLDVSNLEAPEPLHLILEALEHLPTGKKLKVIHRIEPMGLYPFLQNKFSYEIQQTKLGKFEILIWKNDV